MISRNLYTQQQQEGVKKEKRAGLLRACLLAGLMLIGVQAIAQPTFDHASSSLVVCENSVGNSIDENLFATDVAGFTFTWSVAAAPGHGTLSGFPQSAPSGASVEPAGTTYTPTSGYSGADVFTIQVSDANGTATTTIAVTINPTPLPISIPGYVCTGSTIIVSDGTGGGTFGMPGVSSIATVGATSFGTATVTGVSAGLAGITYTLPTGCFAADNITVNTSPAALSGSSTVCTGSTTSLTETSPGGTWASSNAVVGSVDVSGNVMGLTAGSINITYTMPGGCFVIFPMTVLQTPNNITAPGSDFNVCTGSSSLVLADGTGGGLFSSSASGNASIVAGGGTAGTVTGINSSVVNMTYTVPNGCFVTQFVTVNQTPATIAGANSVCVGFQTVLTDLTAGGTWSSSNPLLGTVVASGAGAGTVTGLSTGVPTISYTLNYGGGNTCSALQTMSVNPNPVAIAGSPFQVCTGATINLTDATPGGTWGTSNGFLASVSVGGVVTGNSTGVPTISYVLATGCYALQAVTVNQTPVATTGTNQVCVGTSTTLTNTTGGGNWSSSAGLVASVGAGTGVVNGLSAGTATISYVMPTTCFANFPITVNANPVAIGGPVTVCVGSTITATDATGGGGWTSSNTSVASIDAVTGVITGITAGVSTITYQVTATTCIVTETVTVNANPTSITGTTSICVGTTVTLNSTPAGGTWTSSNGVVATIGPSSGAVNGLTAGSSNITYTLGTGCFAATTVTINPLPSAIGGSAAVCVGSTSTLTDGGGGLWSSGSPAQATIGAGTGILNGVSPGNSTITYTLPTGCSTTIVATVNPNPAAIAGTTSACVGLTSLLNDGTVGGTWSSSNPSLGSVIALGAGAGTVTGVAAGVPTISYALPTGCYATTPFTVNANPAAITGVQSVCTGATTGLSDVTGGGSWSSNNTPVATVGLGTGVVSGVTTGTAVISYTLGTTCYAVATVTVNQTPVAITGTMNVCVGLNTTLSDATPGGSWTSSNGSLATVGGGTGTVTGVASGVPTISYTIGATGCFATTPVTVNANPAAPVGGPTVCVGSTTLFTDATGGGTFSSSNTGDATIGSGTGIASGVLAGTLNIIYTLPTGCLNSTPLTVNPLPAGITGTNTVCTGFTTTLTDATAGGTWTSNNITLATVAVAGANPVTINGIAPGVPTITYTLPTGCIATIPVTVNQTPAAITGVTNACVGSTSTLADPTAGGLWSSSTGAATVGAGTGTVTGVFAGVPNIIYTMPTGCSVSTPFTVNALPASITGTTSVCVGFTTSLADATVGGTWTSSNTTEATVAVAAANPVTINGLVPGSPVITYTLPTGCIATTTVTVNPNPAGVTGTLTVCTGNTTTLADATSGGTWSSSTGAASVGAATGIVTGVTPGTSTITYSLPTGCSAAQVVTVNQTPTAIAGTTNVCIGLTTTLTDGTLPAGTWSSSNPSQGSVVPATGVVTGVAAGILTITYTMATGCFITTPVTVNPNPAGITGLNTVCTGNTIGLADATAGGGWTSSDPTKASIGAGTGVVTGITPGAVTITYALATGCQATYPITVNATPNPITGTTNVCTGFNTTLADATIGGSWSSSNVAEGTVGAGSGVVTGITAGTPTISYSMPTGCYVTQNVTINQTPVATTGTTSVCVGATTVLSDATPGGSWTSTNPGQASVGLNTGIVSGLSVGNPVISYTMPTTCYVLTPITVNPTPAGVTGPSVVCVGSNITMNDATSGGLWSSGNTSVATIVAATGVVTGVSAGAVSITYSLGAGCTASTVITVNPVPDISNFTSTVATSECVGGNGIVTVSSTSLGSGSFTVTYNLSGANAATNVTATLTMGATTGTFTIPSASLTVTGSTTVTITAISNGFGCNSVPLSNNTSTFSVYPLPTVYNVTGGGGYCVGGSGVHVFLSNSVGGINYQLWLGATAVGAPVAGTFSGLDFGAITTVGTYSVTATNATTGCSSNMFGTATIFTNPLPTAFSVTGGGGYCSGGGGVPVGLSNSTSGVNYQLYVGGVATGSALPGSGLAISFGNQTAGGVYTVVATNASTLCTSNMTGSATVVVNPLPAAITGTMFLCPGTTTTLSDATSGGTWSSTTLATATVGASTGVVTGQATPGTATIIYTLPTTCSASAVVTVNPLPSAISGLTTVCVGSAITLTDPTGGGTWSSSNSLLASINVVSGIVTGVAAGTPTLTYTLATGCFATFNITVNPTPVAISGATSVCTGSTTTLVDLTSGGTWSSSTPAIGSVAPATGIVTGLLSGTITVTYTLPAGCSVSTPLTVNPTPPGITGTATVCVGLTTTLADATSGGAWASSNTALGTVNAASGLVGGISAGTITITYTLPAGCFATAPVTVNPTPGAITGSNNVCLGLTTTLGDPTLGGVWSSSNGAVASVGPATGIVTGALAGTASIVYTLPAGCTATLPFTVNPLPASITGVTNVCVGLTTPLNDGTLGGNWSSSNSSIASVVAGTGVVSGVAAGTVTITYTLPTGCIATTSFTVNPNPAAIGGTFTVCANSTTTLTDASAGGAWTSSNTTVGTVASATGVVTGLLNGTTTITYTLPTGCLIPQVVTVFPTPAAIVGSSTVCVGLTTTLTDAVSPGTWTSSNASLATINAVSGLVSGIATGNPTITYTLPAPGSCFVTLSMSVNPQPVAITGTTNVCAGSNVTLVDLTSGGTWSGSNSTVGTVAPLTGIVTGLTPGTTTITYTLPGGCSVSTNFTVNTTPVAITGTPSVCVGLTTALSDLTAGGTWSSSNAAQGSISVTGVVTGLSAGTPVITYLLNPGACIAVYPITVNALPASITGTASVCISLTATLSDASAGGSWTSGNTTIATIGGGTGIVTGIVAGTAPLTYTLPTGCIATTTATVNSLPNIYNVTGGGTYCAGGSGASVGLSNSDAGVNYQLFVGGVSTGSAVAGTGAAITLGTGLTAGTYTVVATNATTGCTSNMNGSATITVTVLPTVFNMTGGGAYCAGGAGVTVGLDGATVGISYQLYDGLLAIGSPVVAASISAFNFPGLLTGAGSYTVIATNISTGCTNNMAGVSSVVVNPLPTAFLVTGGGSYCPGGTGVHIGLSGSTSGVNYTLTGGTAVTLPGTGSALDFFPVTTAATYTIAANNPTTTCSSTMTGTAAVSVNVAPAAQTVTSSGTNPYCPGSVGVTISLSSSQAGVNYQLYNAGSATGPLVAGIAATSITFGPQLGLGRDSVVGINATTGCMTTMTGIITVSANPAPHAFHILSGSGGAICSGSGGTVSVNVDSTAATVSYRLLLGGVATGLPIVGAGPAISFTGLSAPGTYTVLATATTTCTVNLVGSATVSVLPSPNPYTMTGGGSYCAGTTSTVHVTLSGSDLGVRYQLYLGGSTVGTPIAGTSGILDFGAQSASASLYTVVATNITSLCTTTMLGSTTISTIALPTAYALTSGGSYCAGGTGVDIQLSGSSSGVTYRLYNGGTAVDSVLGSAGTIDFGSYAAVGTYTATATSIATGCVANMTGSATVSITAGPAVNNVLGGGAYCAGTSGLPVSIDGSVVGVNYQLYNGTTMIGSSMAGTGSGISFGNQVLAGTYTVKGTSTSTGCVTTMAGTAVITINPAPTSTYSVTGGGSYCSGTGGVLVGLSGSDTGVSYQLFNGATPIIPTVAGTGSAISFGLHVASGTRTVVGTRLSTGCSATMTGSVVVTINALPNLHVVGGGGAYCPGGSGVVITLDSSNIGVNYQLWDGTSPVGSAVAGTNGAISFPLQTDLGTYSVHAVNATTGCVRVMTGSAVVSLNTPPTAFTVSGTAGYCVGTTGTSIALSGSQTATHYQVYVGASTVGVPVAGTGGAMSFGPYTTTGTYTIVAMSDATGCTNTQTGSAIISINPLPTQYNVTGGGSFCAGGTGVTIGLNGSNTSISYQLMNGSTPLGGPLAGTTGAISFGLVTDSGSYTVVATNSVTGCVNVMAGSADVNINSLPLVYLVTGGGTYCAGDAGVHIGLMTSDAGISYQLMQGSTLVGSSVAGLGTPLDFGAITAAGTYSVTATNSLTSCMSNMSGTATVSINPVPSTAFHMTGGGSYCAGGTGVLMGLSGSTSGVSYQLLNGGVPTGTAVAGSGGTLNFGLQTAAGTYMVVSTNSSTGCHSMIADSSMINVNPLPTIDTVTGGGNYCPGGAGNHIGLTSSTSGVNYQLYRDITPLGIVLGTGSALDYGLQTITGTYTVKAADATSGCSATMAGSPAIGISPLPTAYTLTGSSTGYCTGDTGVGITLSGSDVGTQYQLSLGGTPVGLAMSGSGFPINFGLQTSAGTYSVVATSTTTTCVNNMTGTPSITINPLPTQYTVSGGGGFCAGGAGVHVMLGGTDIGVNYQLFKDGAIVGTSVPGTGFSLDFGAETASGAYTVVATASTGCTSNMLSSAAVTANPLPTAYFVVGGGSYCSGTGGAHVGINGSDEGISYQLYLGGTPVGLPMAGNDSALDFGAQTLPGIYRVVGTNTVTLCTNMMNDTTVITVTSLPTAFTVVGGGNYCTGGTGVHIGTTGSASGINYQLWDGGTVVATAAGTGSAVDFGLITGASTYTVSATNPTTGCTNAMTGDAVVSISSLPAIHTVTGSGTYCPSIAGLAVGVDHSESGINYQLYNGGSTVGGLVGGTSGPVGFGLHGTGVYTVVAINATTGCTSNMTGSAVITAMTPVVPSVTVITGVGDTVCDGSAVTFSPLSVNGGSLPTYQWYVNGVPSDTGSSYSFAPANGNVISVTMTSDATCAIPATASGSVTMTVRPNVTPTLTISADPGTTVCQGSTVNLTVTTTNGGTAPSFTWQLNSRPVSGGDSYSFIASDSDVVFATMYSSYACVTSSFALSNNLMFHVQTNLPPVVSINLKSGANVGTVLYDDTLMANVSNPGASPMYQWAINGVVVPGANGPVLYRSTLTNLDQVNLQVTDSNACGNLIGENNLTVISANVGVKPVTNITGDLRLLPNPNNGQFAVKGNLGTTDDQDVTIEVTDMLGQAIYTSKVVARNGQLDEHVTLSNTLPNGMYMVTVHAADESKVFHMVIEQ